MYVAQIMSTKLDTVRADTKLSQAANLMREKNRRFLPVVDEKNRLVGLFSHKELARAAPSDITTLSVGEVNYLTSKITVGELMQQKPLTCSAGTLVEEAGLLMRQNRIGCLPVLHQDHVVGVITEDDILDFLLDITGCRLTDTARIAVHLPDQTGMLGNLLRRINEYGGYIATVVSPVSPIEAGKRIAIIRYRADNPAGLDDHLQELGYDLVAEELPDD